MNFFIEICKKILNCSNDVVYYNKIYHIISFAQIKGMKTIFEECAVPKEIRDLYARHQRGVEIIQQRLSHRQSPLTPREREIALLAKERLSAREIANKLFIEESTVRTILRNVYCKLDIHSKMELGLMEF